MIDPLPIEIEALSLQAWPALTTVEYDGWLLRTAGGYTKRANSVTPLRPGGKPLSQKIPFVEMVFREKGLRPIFRLPSFLAETAVLDAELAARGWDRIDPTDVRVLRLAEQPLVSPSNSNDAAVLTLPAWLAVFHEIEGSEPHPLHHQIAKNITGELIPLILAVDGKAVACGLGVCQGLFVGIFDVVTAVSARRQGHGRALMGHLLRLAAGRGAQIAYLQVMQDNKPAQTLYRQLGFTRLYQYWYRIFP